MGVKHIGFSQAATVVMGDTPGDEIEGRMFLFEIVEDKAGKRWGDWSDLELGEASKDESGDCVGFTSKMPSNKSWREVMLTSTPLEFELEVVLFCSLE